MTRASFRERIRRSIADANLQFALDANARRRQAARTHALAELPDTAERRQRAHIIKADVVEHLDTYLDRFTYQVESNGIHVHRAKDAEEAIHIFLEIAAEHHARTIVKSKSMVSEEIHFNKSVEAAGYRVIETDLGEYIVQLRGERPSHILTPAVHLRREQVGQLFHDKLGVPYTENIPEMVATARRTLRQEFLHADIGVSGVNFGVVETGTLCLATNEGNGRMVTTIPPVHVALMGLERMVPTLADLALFLSLLPRSGTGQTLTAYTSLINTPKREADASGAVERHLILVDNGRSDMRASPLSEGLYCIRCGACLNACPVFREIGGHAYIGRDGSMAPYPGPIGSVISPALFGCGEYGQLAQASSLCGACREACPVDINLPELLLRLRAGEGSQDASCRPGGDLQPPIPLFLKAYRIIASRPGPFHFFQKAGSLLGRLVSPRDGYVPLPKWTGWGLSKDMPRPAAHSFHDRWKAIRQQVGESVPSASIPADEARPVQAPVSNVDRFIRKWTDEGGTVSCTTPQELPRLLTDFLRSRGITEVQVDAAGMAYAGSLQAAGISLTSSLQATIPAGLTGAVTGIAETGSLVLTAGPDASMLASLLPDVHLAILEESKLRPTLEEVLALPEIRAASASVIITGPSRTGDIEMALAIGVHGPKEEHVFLVQDEAP